MRWKTAWTLEDFFSPRVWFPSCLARYLIGGEKEKRRVIATPARKTTPRTRIGPAVFPRLVPTRRLGIVRALGLRAGSNDLLVLSQTSLETIAKK